jgi:hypothetical protein
MTPTFARLFSAGSVLALAIGFVGCSRGSDSSSPTNPNGTTGGTAISPTSSAPPNRCIGAGLDDVGCPCGDTGSTQLCWPGDPALRGRGDCSDGIQTCQVIAEIAVWGPCQAYNIGMMCTGECVDSDTQSCDSGNKSNISTGEGSSGTGAGGGGGSGQSGGEPGEMYGEGGGGGSGSGSTSGGGGDGSWIPPQECVIGSERWCDEPVFCAWGKQVCAPDGRWGRCIETAARPGSCGGNVYDQNCCAAASDGCCQDMAHPSIDSQGHVVYPTLGTCK